MGIEGTLGARFRETLEVRLFGLLQIPMLVWVGPRVLQNDRQAVRILIPLGARTRNHLGSLYIGALVCGADLAGGIAALRICRERGVVLSFVFKDLEAKFLRRADGDVVFECRDVEAIESAVGRAVDTGERVNLPVRVYATVPRRSPTAHVATFVLTLSMKHQPGAKKPLMQKILDRVV